MIPKQLILQNFLSYQQVTLNFDGLHVACVCGPNGAGKSSLLEAIAWCVWGQSRVNAEDDIVRQGAIEAQVSFCFEHNGQTYRIIRTRRRSQNSTLEFQIQQPHSRVTSWANSRANSRASNQVTAQVSDHSDETQAEAQVETQFKTITQKGVRATQQYILSQLKIDYDTFVNAAYLRQGRADEFMLKRPSERKQVLADLLKLNRYDYLCEQAKEKARGYKAQMQTLESLSTQLAAQIDLQAQTQADYEQLKATLEQQQANHQAQKAKLENLYQQKQEQNHHRQELALAKQQQQHQQATLHVSQAALHKAQQDWQACESILAKAAEIERQQQHFFNLKQQEEAQVKQFQIYQVAQSQRLGYQQTIGEQKQQQQKQLSQHEAQLAALCAQEQDLLKILERKSEISQKHAEYHAAKKQLRHLEKKQSKYAPLKLRHQQLQSQIAQAHTRLVTRLEELDNRHAQMTTQQTQSPQLIQAAVEVTHRIEYLEQRRAYQEAVRQKGIERRSFMERLQANQVNCEVQLAQLDRTLQQLADPDAACCPLCDHALEGKTWQDLRDRTAQERDDVQNQIWAIREQLAVCESEIQTLRREYRELEAELAKYAPVLEERGHIKAKLASADTLQDRILEMGSERSQLERCLQENNYADNLHAELQQVETAIAAVDYDDRDRALVRSQIERLRWSEVKYAEIRQAEHQLNKIGIQKPKIERRIQAALSALENIEASPDCAALREIENRLLDLNYSPSEHNQLRAQLRQANIWEKRYQTLQQAKQQQVELQKQLAELEDRCAQQETAKQQIESKVLQLSQTLAAYPDIQTALSELEAAISSYQTQRDNSLSQLGRLQQQLSQLDKLKAQQQQHQQTLSDVAHKHQVYKSLSTAFGRNGIQALMIENLLPQLEAETNQILGKLSDCQLRVQFVTQKPNRSGKSRSDRKIDTLDILIADARGTRPYETYSGGEAFRVNFSIRLAIARLLALRSGMSLKMLIVDEGFGTQDRQGCDRLIAAIEAIAPDFACILTITHMPHFREAFQTRIDVTKDEDGSHISISR